MAKTFDSNDMIANYLSLGGYHFDGKEILKDFDHSAFLPRNRPNGATDHLNVATRLSNYDLHQQDQLRKIQQRISDTLFKDLRHHIFFHDFYDEVYLQSQNWHYDIDLPDWHGYNASLNCYFEDCVEENDDPAVAFTQFDPLIQNTTKEVGEEKIYVKKFDMVLINQTTNFLHRVTRHDKKRPILMFAVSLIDFPATYPLPRK